MGHRSLPMGMRAFIVIWIGQVVSLLGTATTQLHNHILSHHIAPLSIR